ncbi:MAG: hypothetical protein GF341_08425 [candidate division Zixibacteria bacterium]|nr:hypothetical protein [candidate division Zixibacteria bacterium]
MAKKTTRAKPSTQHRQPPSRSAERPSLGLVKMVKAHPVRWAIIGYVLLTVIFFSGALFSPGEMVFGTDSMSAGVFFRSFAADFWASHGRVPLWNPYIHGGLPYVDAMHGDMFYPAAILQLIFPVPYALGLKLILHIFLAGVFMFLFLRRIGCSDIAAFIGGALYMFAPNLVSLIYPGHDGKLFVAALTPLAFLTLHSGTTSRRLGPFLGFGLVYALMVLTAHVQMAYYASWGLGLYFLFLLWKVHRFQLKKIATPVVFFAAAVALALGAAAVQWMAPYEYLGDYSQRIRYSEGRGGYDWATSWSMNSEELLSEVNPDLTGENVQGRPTTYWGKNFFKLNSEAVGVMAVALAIVGVIARPQATTWFFFVMSLIALLHAMGGSTPVFRLFFHFVPMVQKFRAPSMINFLFAFGWIVLAARAIDLLRQERRTKAGKTEPTDPLRVLTIIAGVYTAIALLALVMGESFMTTWASFVGNQLTGNKAMAAQANVSSMSTGFIIGTLVLWGLVGLFWMRQKGSLGQSPMVVGLTALAVLPNWQFDDRFVQTVNPDPYYAERPIVQLIRQNAPNEPYRVLNLPNTLEDNYLALHGIEEISPSAMHGNHLLTHDDFVGRHDPQPALLSVPTTMNLLNVGFIVAPQPLSDAQFQMVGQSQGLYVIRNRNAFPRAAVFYDYEVETDSALTLERLRNQEFPARSKLILPQPVTGMAPGQLGDSLMPFTPARVVEWDVDRMVVECTAERDGLLWLSENYYPAWKAIDQSGTELPIYRADYTFRAVPVSAGEHRITFEFHNDVFMTSVWLTMVCGMILLVGAVITVIGRKPDFEEQAIL